MSTSLNTAVSGLDAYQEQMDIIGNNIANINTVGFKSATGNLANSFSDTLQAATAQAGNDNATDAMQIGTGVMTGSITNDWSPGGINTTNNPSNLYINGNGFFMVQDPVTGAQYATQDGTFQVNPSGYLVQSTTGMEVLGYATSALSGTAAPIKIDATGYTGNDPTAVMTGFTINAQGIVTVNMSDGTSFQRAQVLLNNFTDPQALVSVGSNLYTNMGSAGGLTAPIAAGSGSLVNTSIVSGALELSNVDLSSQMADLIVAQRAFEANSKIVTTSDEMLETVVNMKR
jgi:flagellar hook protein FlgE